MGDPCPKESIYLGSAGLLSNGARSFLNCCIVPYVLHGTASSLKANRTLPLDCLHSGVPPAKMHLDSNCSAIVKAHGTLFSIVYYSLVSEVPPAEMHLIRS